MQHRDQADPFASNPDLSGHISRSPELLMSFDTILVATDFSEHAARALEAAQEIARHSSGRIVLLHCYHLDVPVTYPGIGEDDLIPESSYGQLRRRAMDYVDAAAKRASSTGVDVVGKAVGAEPRSAIVEEAERLSADLIVMGTHGHGPVRHALLGSVAERVIRAAPCPVLTVNAST
jgi:nucleotide-binding universal stress UspA family protein